MSSSNSNTIWRWVRHWTILSSLFLLLYLFLDHSSVNNTYSYTLTPEYGVWIDPFLLSVMVFCSCLFISTSIFQIIKNWRNKIVNTTQILSLVVIGFILFSLNHTYSISFAILLLVYLLYCIYRTIKNYKLSKASAF